MNEQIQPDQNPSKEVRESILELLKLFEEKIGPLLDELVNNEKVLANSGNFWNLLFDYKAKIN